MNRETGELARRIKRLKACLEEIYFRQRAARWAREALEILEQRDFTSAEARELVPHRSPREPAWRSLLRST